MNVNYGLPPPPPRNSKTFSDTKITFPSDYLAYFVVTFSELNCFFFFLFHNCVSYDWVYHNSSNEIHSYALYAPPNVQTVGKLHQSLAEQSPLLWYP